MKHSKKREVFVGQVGPDWHMGAFGAALSPPGALEGAAGEREAQRCSSSDTRKPEGWASVSQGSEDMNSRG